METKLFTLTGVGFKYLGYHPSYLENKTLELKAEPDNKVDKNAVAIYADDVKCGYVSKKETKELAAILGDDLEKYNLDLVTLFDASCSLLLTTE